MPAAFAIAGGCSTTRRRRVEHRQRARCLVRHVSRGEPGRFSAGTLNDVSTMPSGSNRRSRRNVLERLPARPFQQDPEHLRARVVAPPAPGLVQQGQRGEPRDPLVGPEGRRRPGRPERHQTPAPPRLLGPDRCPAAAMMSPKPSRNVSRSSTVMGRSAGDRVVERCSRGCAGRAGRPARATSSRPGRRRESTPSSTSTIAPARRSASSATRCERWHRAAAASGRPSAGYPSTSTCTSSPRATSATKPGTSPRRRDAARRSCSRASPAAIEPEVGVTSGLHRAWRSCARRYR